MRTAYRDSLRLQVLQEVMDLSDEQLIKLHTALAAISEKDDAVLYNLLHSSADELQEDKSTYSTENVMRDIDKEMGWK